MFAAPIIDRWSALTAAVLASLAGAGGPRSLTVYSSLPLTHQKRAIYEDIVRGEQLALERQARRRSGPARVRLVSLNNASLTLGTSGSETGVSQREPGDRDASTIAYLSAAKLNSRDRRLAPHLNKAGSSSSRRRTPRIRLTRREAAGARSVNRTSTTRPASVHTGGSRPPITYRRLPSPRCSTETAPGVPRRRRRGLRVQAAPHARAPARAARVTIVGAGALRSIGARPGGCSSHGSRVRAAQAIVFTGITPMVRSASGAKCTTAVRG